MKKFALYILALFFVSFANAKQEQQLISVGISSETFNYYASSQNNSNWCWAASLQMIFNYYGINISQEQIVYRSYGTDPYGNLPNWTGSFQVVTANLNNWNVDNSGRSYLVTSMLGWGAPTPAYLINELENLRPVLIGYQSGPNSGHAVVITALSYIQTMYGPQIQTIVVRDPWPSGENIKNNGRVEYQALNLAQVIQAYWFIRIM